MEPAEFLDEDEIARLRSRFRQDMAHAETGRESTEEERRQARRELQETMAEAAAMAQDQDARDQDTQDQDPRDAAYNTGDAGPAIRTVGELRSLTRDMDDDAPILIHGEEEKNTLQQGVDADRKTVLAEPDGSFRERPGGTEKGAEPTAPADGVREIEALLLSPQRTSAEGTGRNEENG